ncbi:MAG: IS1634 family transposase [Okeania sp. SIO2G4]|uniref:IS1634 family transposase n=1 Tax=unclassified Okeania TaxID=2634635 RepID=UPI0013B74E76|nr:MULTISPECIES: IS1634 family transposase [unclassified Okeania]NEP06838.1 IS1634 family transposase [Okeania sp. SIO4D6]NEP73654.1 IS1634 family transposase [Okeania sp. SIO2G5]NEP94396.1 IS1634 family transposase [Okeania sp. SIO2F5]NEQ92214.1 IS1634 family transposase [Okeania sp. SIO2G4]
MSQLSDEVFKDAEIKGYRLASSCSQYGGIKQRWLVDERESRKKADLEQLEQKITTAGVMAKNKLLSLSQEKFACVPDAEQAAQKLGKELRYHALEDLEFVPQPRHGKPGRPRKGVTASNYYYRIKGNLVLNSELVNKEKNRAGRFILATNVLEHQFLSDDELLREYKAQQSTERGFRFLKDPMFFADSIFLKNPERVAALAMVMGLCLLVYSLGQRALRQALQAAKKSIPNQVGTPTTTPISRTKLVGLL